MELQTIVGFLLLSDMAFLAILCCISEHYRFDPYHDYKPFDASMFKR